MLPSYSAATIVPNFWKGFKRKPSRVGRFDGNSAQFGQDEIFEADRIAAAKGFRPSETVDLLLHRSRSQRSRRRKRQTSQARACWACRFRFSFRRCRAATLRSSDGPRKIGSVSSTPANAIWVPRVLGLETADFPEKLDGCESHDVRRRHSGVCGFNRDGSGDRVRSAARLLQAAGLLAPRRDWLRRVRAYNGHAEPWTRTTVADSLAIALKEWAAICRA